MVREKRVDFCTNCRRDTSYTLQKKTIQKTIKDKDYNFEITVALCDECGEEMDIPGLLDENIKSIDEQYRRAERLVSIGDITDLMVIYNIGKAPLSTALGFGEITITRYLAGQMPCKEYSDIILRAIKMPSYMINKLDENADKIGETAYKKARSAADKIADMFGLSEKMTLTISYIFEQMQEVTPLALQKILYYAQGIYMVEYDEPLFDEDCMAWVHGPVYEKVYNLFKDFKFNPIEDNRFAIIKQRYEELGSEEKRVIDLVVNTFGRYSGKTLESITHTESPWKDAREGYEASESSREIISKDDIKSYFAKVKREYGSLDERGINEYITSHL